MRIVVVEPHSDDAFLSLGWHLEKLWADKERVIITVFSDNRRNIESANYAKTIGARSVSLTLPETNLKAPINRKPIPELINALKKYAGDQIIFPLGLQHPDHIRTVISRRPIDCLRYVDTPYQTKLKLHEELNDKMESMVIESICFPPKKKWRHIETFKSQSLFFHYNPMEETKIPEILLRNPE